LPKPPIIIGGSPRSGTTLLRLVVDSHPNIACGPEMKIIPAICQTFVDHDRVYGSHLQEQFHIRRETHAGIFGDHINSILEDYRSRTGKRRVAEKTPENIFYFEQLAEIMPASPLIHLIRDGREVILSLMRTNWIDPSTGKAPNYVQDIRAAAQFWVRSVTFGRRIRDNPAARYLELRYEDLTTDLEATMRTFLAFVDEPWSYDVIEYTSQEHQLSPGDYVSQGYNAVRPVDARTAGMWRTIWSPEQVAAVREIAGDLLTELGYSDGTDW